jgi:hypothetical protein
MAIKYKKKPVGTGYNEGSTYTNEVDPATPESEILTPLDLQQIEQYQQDLSYQRSLYGPEDAYAAEQKSIDSMAQQYELMNDTYLRTQQAMQTVPMPENMQAAMKRDISAGVAPQAAWMYAGTGGIVDPITGKAPDGLIEGSQAMAYGNALAYQAGGYDYNAMNNAYLSAAGIDSPMYPGYSGYYKQPTGKVPTPYYVSQSSSQPGYVSPYPAPVSPIPSVTNYSQTPATSSSYMATSLAPAPNSYYATR